MAKFIDKKQQVLDFQLTPYGKHKLSLGNFRPTYYAFYDGEVLYDSQYAQSSSIENTSPGSPAKEPQQNIHKRIKEETAYIGSLVAFSELENSVPPSPLETTNLHLMYHKLRARAKDPLDSMGEAEADELYDALEIAAGYDSKAPMSSHELRYFSIDLGESSRQDIPSPDIYRYGQPLGDARFDGPTQQNAPAWKAALLQGSISSSFPINLRHAEERIPQLNTTVTYKKRIQTIHDMPAVEDPSSVSQVLSTTPTFIDDSVISLIRGDLLAYIEEVNTELLTENFDIQVFKVEKLPATKAIGKIFFSTTKCPTAGETITIKDGISEAVFEFIDIGGTPTNPSAIAVYRLPIERDPGCFSTTITFCNAVNDSSRLQVTVDFAETLIAAMEATKVANHVAVTLLNNVEQRPDQWTNYRITETMADGYAHGFESGSASRDLLHPKEFARTNPQIVNGMMMYPTAPDTHMFGNNDPLTLTSGSVEYYFDIHVDAEVDQKQACRGSEMFNKDSYYIDLEFECEEEELCADDKRVFYDIYGSNTADGPGDGGAAGEPEICEDD